MWMHVKFLKTLNTQRISLILTSAQVEVRKRGALTWFFLKIKKCALIMKIILLKIPVCKNIVHIFLFKNTILRKLEAFNSTLFPAEHLIVIFAEINIGKTSSSRKITACKSISIYFSFFVSRGQQCDYKCFSSNEDVCCEMYSLDGKVSIVQHNKVYKDSRQIAS